MSVSGRVLYQREHHLSAVVVLEVAPPGAEGVHQQQAAAVLGVVAGAHGHRGQRAGVPDHDEELGPVGEQPQPYRGGPPVRLGDLDRIGHDLGANDIPILTKYISVNK